MINPCGFCSESKLNDLICILIFLKCILKPSSSAVGLTPKPDILACIQMILCTWNTPKNVPTQRHASQTSSRKHDLPFKSYGYFICCCHCGSQDEDNRTGATEDRGRRRAEQMEVIVHEKNTFIHLADSHPGLKRACYGARQHEICSPDHWPAQEWHPDTDSVLSFKLIQPVKRGTSCRAAAVCLIRLKWLHNSFLACLQKRFTLHMNTLITSIAEQHDCFL